MVFILNADLPSEMDQEMNEEMKIIETDWFPVEYKFRMTLEHEGVTYYWHGLHGEGGSGETWFVSKEKKIERPDFIDELDPDLFEYCDENAKPWLPYQVREQLEKVQKLLWGGSETENIEAHNIVAEMLKEKVSA
jgi:hypothetical protein